ncbi:MAG: hypothetical protein PVI06_02680, partial [Desulfobacterales bacterium]
GVVRNIRARINIRQGGQQPSVRVSIGQTVVRPSMSYAQKKLPGRYLWAMLQQRAFSSGICIDSFMPLAVNSQL